MYNMMNGRPRTPTRRLSPRSLFDRRGHADLNEPRKIGGLVGRFGASVDPRQHHEFTQRNGRRDRAPIVKIARQIAVDDEPPVERERSPAAQISLATAVVQLVVIEL